MTRIIELIITSRHEAGGSDNGVFRLVDQLWTLDGDLVAEHDPEGNYEASSINSDSLTTIRPDAATSWWNGRVASNE